MLRSSQKPLQNIKKLFIGLVAILTLPQISIGQESNTEVSDLERTFMPAIQIGYIGHGTEELSGGLMIQTSIGYRDISNFILRINYDDFNSNMNLSYPINQEASFSGRTSFSELIGGIGYRQTFKTHNITGYIQPGIRFYGYPNFEIDNNQVNLDFDSRNIGMIRYSLGYEYAIAPKLFLTVESLISHVLKPKDFWADNSWYYGVTFGISMPLI